MSEERRQRELETRTGVPIRARDLTRQFGPHRALRELDLEIHAGETFGLLGANGAGKTTFIRLVTGYLVPSAGEITVDGLSPVANPRAVQALIGYVPERPRLYPELRVAGFLRFAAGLRGLRGPARRRAVESALERFELTRVARRLVGNLSKGYQQRVSLAQAFLHEPPLLIIDEPSGGLDPLQRDQVHAILRALGGHRTILLCTHDLEEARVLASRVAILNRGRLTGIGAPEDLLGRGDALEAFRTNVGREDSPSLPPEETRA